MRYIFILLISLIIFSGCGKEKTLPTRNEQGVFELEQEYAKYLIDNEDVVIVDVRPAYAYNSGHIKDSINIPYTDIHSVAESKIEDKKQKILIYSDSDEINMNSALSFILLGYDNIGTMGTIATWRYGIEGE